MVGQAGNLSIENDGQGARRHQTLFLFAITFENPYILANAYRLGKSGLPSPNGEGSREGGSRVSERRFTMRTAAV